MKKSDEVVFIPINGKSLVRLTFSEFPHFVTKKMPRPEPKPQTLRTLYNQKQKNKVKILWPELI